MLPPKSVCNPAPILPTMLRDRTTIPRTIPRFRRIRCPGNSRAVVTRLAVTGIDYLLWNKQDRWVRRESSNDGDRPRPSSARRHPAPQAGASANSGTPAWLNLSPLPSGERVRGEEDAPSKIPIVHFDLMYIRLHSQAHALKRGMPP